MKFGYARVSTDDQKLHLQIDALTEAGCQRIFQEKVSGLKKKRPELENLLSFLREGDTVVVYKLDRLGRSLQHLIQLTNQLKDMGVGFHSIRDGVVMDDSATGQLMIHLLGAFAQFESDLISQRTREGLAAASKRGRKGGRPPGLSDAAKKKAKVIAVMYTTGEMAVSDIAKNVGVSISTLYKYLKHEGIKTGESLKAFEKKIR